MCLASFRMVPSSLADVLGPCQLYQAHLGMPDYLLPDLPLHPKLLTACTGSAGKPVMLGDISACLNKVDAHTWRCGTPQWSSSGYVPDASEFTSCLDILPGVTPHEE